MKRRALPLFVLCISISLLCACTKGEPHSGDTAPTILMYGNSYVAQNMPVNELPEDYTSSGTLTSEEAHDTGLEGCEYFLNIRYDSVPDMYVYQEKEYSHWVREK
ncbi:MAG: hypothetical protein PHC41_13695 [Lachnospiraceae bacterium]|nr:hypothetical protein [Lachnospiraceae bacterium]MDD3617259.1 hypothetical protein [Lachnospiraceae bacterium]